MGLKFVFAGFVSVSSTVCFVVIMGICITSIVSSYWLPRFRDNCQRIDLGAIAPITEAMEEGHEDEEDREAEEAHAFFERRQHVEEAALPTEDTRGRGALRSNELDLELAT